MNAASRHFDVVLPAPFGMVGIRTSAGAISEITYLPEATHAVAPKNALADRAALQIERYLLDARYRFDLPLSVGGTAYQRRVWEALIAIPVGELLTYGRMARLLRSSARAVGQACGANRLPIVIPCHRVVSASGIGGFAHHTDGYFIAIKKWLLAHEAGARTDTRVAPTTDGTAPV